MSGRRKFVIWEVFKLLKAAHYILTGIHESIIQSSKLNPSAVALNWFTYLFLSCCFFLFAAAYLTCSADLCQAGLTASQQWHGFIMAESFCIMEVWIGVNKDGGRGDYWIGAAMVINKNVFFNLIFQILRSLNFVPTSTCLQLKQETHNGKVSIILTWDAPLALFLTWRYNTTTWCRLFLFSRKQSCWRWKHRWGKNKAWNRKRNVQTKRDKVKRQFWYYLLTFLSFLCK